LNSSEVTTVVLGATVVVVLGAIVVVGAEVVVVASSATDFGATSPSATDPASLQAEAARVRAIMMMVAAFLTRVLPVDRFNVLFIGISRAKVKPAAHVCSARRRVKEWFQRESRNRQSGCPSGSSITRTCACG
jgi:hypothetical protein